MPENYFTGMYLYVSLFLLCGSKCSFQIYQASVKMEARCQLKIENSGPVQSIWLNEQENTSENHSVSVSQVFNGETKTFNEV